MSETHGARAARVFGPELAKIGDQRVKDFVIRCYETICPDYFWERPASKRGIYHPAFVDGPGGLVRHVKYGCWLVEQLVRAFSGNGKNEDLGPPQIFNSCMAAMIMHDMVKDGDPGRTIPKAAHPMGAYHGVELAEAIWLRVLGGKVEFDEQLLIIYGVAAHMGVWTQPEEFRPWNLKGSLAVKVATIVHMADYVASRKVDEVILTLAKFQP